VSPRNAAAPCDRRCGARSDPDGLSEFPPTSATPAAPGAAGVRKLPAATAWSGTPGLRPDRYGVRGCIRRP